MAGTFPDRRYHARHEGHVVDADDLEHDVCREIMGAVQQFDRSSVVFQRDTFRGSRNLRGGGRMAEPFSGEGQGRAPDPNRAGNFNRTILTA